MSTALLTIVHNERRFLPIWLEYYRHHFADQDIYILDNDTDDGSTDGLTCNVESFSTPTRFDAQALLGAVTRRQASLLRDYDYVVFAEADEIIATPKGNLVKRIETSGQDVLRCKGYEILQDLAKKELPLVLEDRPLLKQRSKWYHSLYFSKPTIARIPLVWHVGFHVCNHMPDISDDFYLVHLHRLDFNIALERLVERQRGGINRTSLNNHWGWQNFFQKRSELMTNWYHWTKPLGGFVDMPEWVKGLL